MERMLVTGSPPLDWRNATLYRGTERMRLPVGADDPGHRAAKKVGAESLRSLRHRKIDNGRSRAAQSVGVNIAGNADDLPWLARKAGKEQAFPERIGLAVFLPELAGHGFTDDHDGYGPATIAIGKSAAPQDRNFENVEIAR